MSEPSQKRKHFRPVALGFPRHYYHPERMEITKPRVARNELPWGGRSNVPYPERVASQWHDALHPWATPNIVFKPPSSLETHGSSRVLPGRLPVCMKKYPMFMRVF